MAKTKTRPWEPARYLGSEKDMAEYLNIALEEGDLKAVVVVLGTILRARKMFGLAGKLDGESEALQKSLLEKDQPDFSDVSKLIRMMGYQLQARPVEDVAKSKPALVREAGEEYEA